ncbi:hypothetical protein QYF36_016020 [Acer negundo]|nr:hypothetical protein QYF36_016020 [Acer negundo]
MEMDSSGRMQNVLPFVGMVIAVIAQIIRPSFAYLVHSQQNLLACSLRMFNQVIYICWHRVELSNSINSPAQSNSSFYLHTCIIFRFLSNRTENED